MKIIKYILIIFVALILIIISTIIIVTMHINNNLKEKNLKYIQTGAVTTEDKWNMMNYDYDVTEQIVQKNDYIVQDPNHGFILTRGFFDFHPQIGEVEQDDYNFIDNTNQESFSITSCSSYEFNCNNKKYNIEISYFLDDENSAVGYINNNNLIIKSNSNKQDRKRLNEIYLKWEKDLDFMFNEYVQEVYGCTYQKDC